MEFNATFLVSAISFILFTLIMNKIFYKPLENIINEREKFINDNIVDAKFSNDKANAILKAKEEKLAKTEVDAKQLVTKKINQANEKSRNKTEQAKQKTKEDISSAKQALLEEAEQTKEEFAKQVEEISEIITSKVLNITE